MNIIQVRGTSGSGKTWVAKSLLQKLESKKLTLTPVYVDKRKKPLFYKAKLHPYSDDNLAILGHYESNCGGCDNIGSAAKVYELINEMRCGNLASHNIGQVFCEGLLLSEDTKWTFELAEKLDVAFQIIFLSTDVEVCIQQIKKRRELVGNEKELNEDNTRNRVRVIERAFTKCVSNPNLLGCITKSSSKGASQLVYHYLGLL
jgi:ABC-type dipeptide/oligopeptide/nickel transport system ATPase component